MQTKVTYCFLCWQVWFRVNEQLPVELQKSLPDTPPEQAASEIREGGTSTMVHQINFEIVLLNQVLFHP